ncbi:hypothetical protein LSAT2_023806 [Lamellibrachia satsuma]|nr:hypothetical protein LSAT2_023806 [Lamellibrachia satsuma]
MSYDGSYVYVDSIVTERARMTGMTKITPLPMNIGSLFADPFDGHMDSISFFKRALTAADVQSLYNNRGVCSPP